MEKISKEEFIKQAKELGTSDIEIKEIVKDVEKYPVWARGTGYAFSLELLHNPGINFDD